ncbi:dTDP-4-dehydrorhamnose 3,5-epimerase [Pseudoroseomonas globiformis]|uniref:dTDP-4-dehydrorhamnose 3,5-epimerase n=1 Tax=Teichococcus globiformis TaxID=2307229 RepID=A0ABV7G2T2_9PROT
MKFNATPLKDAYVIEMEPRGDERGFFARAYCEDEFREAGLVHHYAQVNNSLSVTKGTLRGMHYQLPPASEVKLVRCLRGALYDVIADMRPDSPSYGQWFGVELTEDNRKMLYVPRGFAHGFVTLRENTEAFYMVSDAYMPGGERGLRYDDPHLAIEWPIKPELISEKDQNWPAFDPEYHGVEQLRGIR